MSDSTAMLLHSISQRNDFEAAKANIARAKVGVIY